MSYTLNRNEENKDKALSAAITAVIWTCILLFAFLYTIKENKEKAPEIITTMLVNFGDNQNGSGIEEPTNQEGSLAAETDNTVEEPVKEVKTEPKPVEISKPVVEKPKAEPRKKETAEKILTGKNQPVSVPKTSKASEKKIQNTTPAKSINSSASKPKTSEANAKKGNGDGKGDAAIGNFIRGRNQNGGTSQGNSANGIGNAGDPLGGDGNGDSKIGIDRKLTGYIPGTEGRGGSQPPHKCTVGGTITIAYIVDKFGNVTSARRAGGISDPCVVSTSIEWVKKYVKAEKANTSSSGTYKITF